jgi:hypothetical protein
MDDVALDRRGHLGNGVEGSTEDNFRLVRRSSRFWPFTGFPSADGLADGGQPRMNAYARCPATH